MNLTKKQKQVLDFITEYLDKHGYSPTQAEIRDHFELKSLGSVQDYVKYLLNSGYLVNDHNATRGLRPAERVENAIPIPLLGKVAAGVPIEYLHTQKMVHVPHSMMKRGDFFALQVSGDSMIDEGIWDGDVIVVKKQETADNGQIVVAAFGHEATLKRFYKKARQVELHSANPKFKPMLFKEGQLEIKGILVGLLRHY